MTMYDDKTLLELAAKAAGIVWVDCAGHTKENGWWVLPNGQTQAWWNPLTDDGDALRLAVKLGLDLDPWLLRKITTVIHVELEENIYEDHGDDPYAATRRAIVRAAASIGEKL